MSSTFQVAPVIKRVIQMNYKNQPTLALFTKMFENILREGGASIRNLEFSVSPLKDIEKTYIAKMNGFCRPIPLNFIFTQMFKVTPNAKDIRVSMDPRNRIVMYIPDSIVQDRDHISANTRAKEWERNENDHRAASVLKVKLEKSPFYQSLINNPNLRSKFDMLTRDLHHQYSTIYAKTSYSSRNIQMNKKELMINLSDGHGFDLNTLDYIVRKHYTFIEDVKLEPKMMKVILTICTGENNMMLGRVPKLKKNMPRKFNPNRKYRK